MSTKTLRDEQQRGLFLARDSVAEMLVLRRVQRLVLVALFIVVVLYYSAWFGSTTLSAESLGELRELARSRVNGKTGYNWIFSSINVNNPSVGPLTQYKNGEKAKEKFATDDDFVFSKSYLSSLLAINDLQVNRLKSAHQSYLKDIQDDKHEWFGNENVEPQGDGIVFVGGIKFSWLALIGIEQLRLLGCRLPIEVFIGTHDEFEQEFCNVILPKYNARCTVLEDEIGDIAKKLGVEVSGFQYKLLALMVSKFENILFLDADNVPLRDPTPLMSSRVFQRYGLVIWPDAWARTTNPKYYDIAGLKVTKKIVRGPYSKRKDTSTLDLNKDVSFHDFEGTLPNPSSESGMILVNKNRHTKTLLLSLYYNIFGPKLYYALFSQGSAGEGDKETFISAATVLNATYYQVLEPFRFIGFHDDEGKFNSKALGQADPQTDYENLLKGSYLDEHNKLLPAKNAKRPPIYFMHLSYPKLIPVALLSDNEIIKKGSNEHIRMYLSSTQEAKYDFELRIFQIIAGALCKNYQGHTPISERLIGLKLKEYWGQDPSTFCPQLIDHVKFLEDHPE